MELTLKPNMRLTFVGKTRSGKTFLSWYLLRVFTARNKDLQVVKIDPKHEHRKFGKGETLDTMKLVTRYEPKTRFQVFQSFTWNDQLEDMVTQVLKRGNVIVDLDELGGIASATTVPTGITRLWTMGGGKGVGAWSKMQRPSRVPQVIKTQSECFFIFRINSMEDRKHLTEYISDDRLVTQKLPLKYFWVFTDDMDKAILCKPIKIASHLAPH